jgi:hypothetical protein
MSRPMFAIRTDPVALVLSEQGPGPPGTGTALGPCATAYRRVLRTPRTRPSYPNLVVARVPSTPGYKSENNFVYE